MRSFILDWHFVRSFFYRLHYILPAYYTLYTNKLTILRYQHNQIDLTTTRSLCFCYAFTIWFVVCYNRL